MPAETTIQTQAEVEENMVDLPAEGESIDVELPKKIEKTINPDPEPEAVETEVKTETASTEEMDDYGKKVQSRIDKLTKRLRESERREQAAIQFAQGVQSEQQKLQGKVKSLDSGYLTEFSTRVEAETAETKKALKAALDAGDIDQQVDANQKLARLAIEHERVKATQAQRERLKRKWRHVELTQISHKCHNNPFTGHNSHLLHRIQRRKIGLQRIRGSGKMNQ